jgi:hypothetical protein
LDSIMSHTVGIDELFVIKAVPRAPTPRSGRA